MTTGPFGFTDLREQRRRRLGQFRARAQTNRIEREETTLSNVVPARNAPFTSTLPQSFESRPDPFNGDPLTGNPLEFDPALEPPPNEPKNLFGGGTLEAVGGFFEAVSRGDTQGIGGPDIIEKPLEAVAKPFAVLGQGVFKVLGKSAEVGGIVASHVTQNVQRLIPGEQEFERLIAENRKNGMSHSAALERAWEEVSLGKLTIPFFETALTPHGSISIGFKDVIAAGFDPINIAFTFGTGGFGAGLGIRGAISGRQTLAQAARTAVGRSIGARGTRALGRKAAATPRFLGDPVSALGIERALTGISTEATLVLKDPRRVIGSIPAANKLETQVLGRVKKSGIVNRLSRNSKLARRIIGIASPARVARESAGGNFGSEAAVIYEASAAHGSNLVDAAILWVNDAGDPIKSFAINEANEVTAANIKLSATGKKAFTAAGLSAPGPVQFGDIAEFFVKGLDEGVDPRSLFEGLLPEQIEWLDRANRATKEMIDELISEKVYKDVDEAFRGKQFKDAQNNLIVDGAGKPVLDGGIGDPALLYRYFTRKVNGKMITTVADDGRVTLLEYGGKGSGGIGRGGVDYTKSRTYELMSEGAREGIIYGGPTENLQAFLSGGYRQIAEKRALDHLARRGQTVTSKQVLNRLYAPVVDRRIASQKFYGVILRNYNRVKANQARRKVKAPLLNKAVEDAATREAEIARRIDRLIDQQTNDVLRYNEHMDNAAGVGTNAAQGNAGSKVRAKRAANDILATYKERARRVNELEILQRKAIDDQVAGHRRVNIIDDEMFGLTDDLAQAEGELKIAQLTLKEANREYTDTLARIADAKTLDQSVFGGGTKGIDEPVRMYHDGPLSGKLAPADVGDALQKQFGDRGSAMLSKIELVTGTARTMSAGSADIGWLAIQGAMLAFTHPKIWAQAAAKSIKAIGQPERLNRYVAQNLDTILDFIENGGDIGGSEFFQSVSAGGGLDRITQGLRHKFPEGTAGRKYLDIWSKDFTPIGRLGTGFNTFLDVSKVELWKSLRGLKSSGHVTDGELARHINNMMGTMNSRMLGVSPTQRQLEGALFLFSPRFTRSAFALMGELLRGPGRPGTTQGLATREAMRAISGLIGGGTLALVAVAEAVGSPPPELNPFKPGWMTIEIGGQTVGIGGSTRALLDVMAKSSYAVSGMGDRDALDLLKFNPFDLSGDARENPILSYWLNRTAPGVRELLTQETFDGEKFDNPIDFGIKGMAPKFLPFAAQEMIDPGPGVPRQSPFALIPETLGLRARPLSAFERLEKKRDELAQAIHGKPWDGEGGTGLDASQKSELERDNPALRRLTEVAHSISSPVLGPYFARVENDSSHIDGLINTAADEFLAKQTSGITDGNAFRRKVDSALTVAFNLRQIRENPDGEFGDALETLEESRENRLDSQTELDRLYDEYLTEVLNNPVSVRDAFGNVNFSEQNRLEQEFRARIGEEMFARVRRHHLRVDENGESTKFIEDIAGGNIMLQLRRDKEVLREAGYWKVAEDIIGDDEQALALWAAFEAIGNPSQQEVFKREYPELIRVEKRIRVVRQRMRRENFEVDQALFRWYGFRPINRNLLAAERVEQRQFRENLRQPVGAGA